VDTPARYTIAVRALCEFTAKQGDLDLRFTPAPSAQEGVAGHQAVAARRGSAYRTEVSLSGRHRHLAVRGRADGFDANRGRVEEIKTHKGEVDRIPDNHRQLHWAQAKVYGWLLCQQHELPQITVALVYFEIGKQRETVLEQVCSADELRGFFESLCERFMDWADREIEHRAGRDASLAALRFPHADFRAGQRTLAESTFKAARLGRCLMAQAPTGIGKTIGTIFPLLKACPPQELDKVFFLTAKSSGRSLALEAIDALRAAEPGMPLRVIELCARDKVCEHPDKACHGESCPLAQGFYDRLPAAREAAAQQAVLSREVLRQVAAEHQVCPYYLSQEMTRWSDVVVGDYNYFFDSPALLHGLTQLNQWRVAVLVDEAHNLLERARAMYTAELAQDDFRAMRRSAPASLKKPLDRLNRAWNAVGKAQAEPYEVLPEVPPAFLSALQDATSAITELLSDQPTALDADAMRFYFDALHFSHLLDSFGTHSLFDVSVQPGARRNARLCVRNVVPAPFLKPRFEATRTTVLFSATLTPQHFYADTLGLPDDTAWIDVEAPFSAEQLQVNLVRGISTRYQHRRESVVPIADLIAAQYARRPGNYLAFFSSFEYLEQVALEFELGYPTVPMWAQSRRMSEPERDAFLSRFVEGGQGIGFAVLGGAFAEGIDLPGDLLIGAFIATLGLPQFNRVNEEMRRRMDETFGEGYDYTYLFPGIRKVVQAAGRVIRTTSDRGSVHLIDDRFARPEVMKLLPAWWQLPRRGSAAGEAEVAR
jgi:DNA excision repair protein ERCC-2